MKKGIGQLIAEVRKKKKMSQEELAEKLHISRQTLSSWETGRSEPTANMLVSICKLLAIDISNIIHNEDELVKLVNSEKKKTSRVYLMFISLLFVVAIVLFYLLIVIFNSNKFTVYELQLNSDNYYLDDGILILSKEKNQVPLVILLISQRFVCRCILHKNTFYEQVCIHHSLDNVLMLV